MTKKNKGKKKTRVRLCRRNYNVKYNAKDRTIYLKGEITPVTPILVERAAKNLSLDQLNSSRPIFLFINSVGGDFFAMMKIWHTLTPFQNNLITIATGKTFSAGMSLFQLGKLRFAVSGTKFLIHEATVSFEKIRISRSRALEIFNDLAITDSHQFNILSKRGRPINLIQQMLNHESYFGTKTALELKLIDGIFREKNLSKIREKILQVLDKIDRRHPKMSFSFLTNRTKARATASGVVLLNNSLFTAQTFFFVSLINFQKI